MRVQILLSMNRLDLAKYVIIYLSLFFVSQLSIFHEYYLYIVIIIVYLFFLPQKGAEDYAG